MKNRDDRNFTIGRWGEHNRNVGQKKALAKNIAISDLKKREKSVDTLNEKEKKQLNFGKKIKTLPLTAFLLKKMKNCGGGTKTPSAAGVANSSNAKKDLVTYPPTKENVQMCKGNFVDYMNISFRLKLSDYIQYASIADGSIYKVGHVG